MSHGVAFHPSEDRRRRKLYDVRPVMIRKRVGRSFVYAPSFIKQKRIHPSRWDKNP